MKVLTKSAIALAVAATTSMPVNAQMTDGAAPQVTGVSGRFRIAVICDDVSDTCDQQDFGGRFRINAEEELGNGNSVFGRYEFEVDGSEALLKSAKGRRVSYVGIRGDFGSFSLGTRWSPFYNVVGSPSDYTKAFGGTWRAGAYNDLGGPFRLTNGLYYSVGGFQSMVQIADNGDSVTEDNEDIDRVELAYTFGIGGDWNLGLAASQKSINQSTKGVPGTDKSGDVRLYGINANGHVGATRLSLSYITNDDTDDSGFLGQAQTPVGAGTLSFSFGTTNRDISGEGDPTMVALEYESGLGPNSAWFVGIENNDPDTTADDTTAYGAGIHYNFN